MKDHNEDFKRLIAESGLPTTQEEVKQRLNAEVDLSELGIKNDSLYSSFWRAIEAMVAVPVMWLIDALINVLLPNFFIKTASGLWLSLRAWELGITRKTAVKLQGLIDFSRTDAAGVLSIEAGQVIQTLPLNGVVYKVTTTEAVVFADGETIKRVAVEAEKAGAIYNLAGGYFNQLQQPISGVTVTNASDWITRQGADEESDDDLRARCQNAFIANNQYHTDAVYIKLITEFAGIGTKNVFFDSNAPRGAGTADAYIVMDTGQPDAQLLVDIDNHIMVDGHHGHGDDLKALAMPGVDHSISCTAYAINGLSADSKLVLKAQVEDFIRAAFRENKLYSPTTTFPHSQFSFSVLASEMHEELELLQSIKFSNNDIVSALNIPRLTAVTVQVP